MPAMVNLVDESKPRRGFPWAGAVQRARLSPAYSMYVTVMLALVATLSATDRNILSVLLVPIQKDLGVGDAAMGALVGSSFALIYATTALPMARLGDRTNRRNLLAIAVAFWSAATAVCGLATSFVQLLLARVGVAAGESAQHPVTMSMIADMFPASRRGAAISVITIGSVVGYSLGAFLAGTLNDHYGWHVALMAVGLPGVLLALVIFFTVPEPIRGAHDGGVRHDPTGATLKSSLAYLMKLKTMPPLVLGLIFLNIAFSGWLIWLPAFLMRVHHLKAAQMSAVFGLIVGVGAILSNIVAGVLSDKLAQRGTRWRLYYCCISLVLSIPFLAASSLIDDTTLAVACMVAYTLVSGGLTTVTGAAVLSVARPTMRAFMTAILAFCVSVFGGGVGPYLIGLLNDILKKTYAEEALRYTLLVAPVMLFLALICFFIASRFIDDDAARANAEA
jgi:predicted MFS family arabinose efflux permease